MKNIAFIPLRGGSKGVPRKNIKLLNNRPLCDWVIKSSIKSNIFDQIWVSTDDDEIELVARSSGALIHRRNPETGSDKSTSVEVLNDFLQFHTSDIITYIQATSPFTEPKHFIEAYQLLNDNPDIDSIITCVRLHMFRWSEDSKPQNYDPLKRPRRQDWNGELYEDGSFYMMKTNEFIKKQSIPPSNDKTLVYELPYNKHLEIDEPIDFTIMNNLASIGFGYNISNNTTISVDIGGTYIRSAIVDPSKKLLNLTKTTFNNSNNNFMAELTNLLKIQLKYSQNNKINIDGISISSGGIIDQSNNIILDGTNIDNWKNIELPKYFENIPLKISNDGNCVLLYEKYLNFQDYQNIASFHVGTGVAIGLLLNGKIVQNSECGRIFESFLSGNSFDINNLKMIADKMVDNIINLIELLNLEIVTISGFIIQYSDLINNIKDTLNKKMREYFKERCIVYFDNKQHQSLIGSSFLFDSQFNVW